MGIIDELKERFKKGSVMTRLIYINVAVYIIINLIDLFCLLLSISNLQVVSWLAVPANVNDLAFRPWTILSYMFLHKDFFHILFNMLWFFWFAKIFLDYLDAKRLIATYIIGGIAGALFFILAFNIFPVFKPYINKSVALGASASVIAVVTAISFYVPNMTLNLLFIGPVKLKWIAIATIAIDILSISAGNPGGHIAHLGGAFWGFLFITQFKKGLDLSKWFVWIYDSIAGLFIIKPKIKVKHKRPVSDMDYNYNKTKEQQRINEILDKISKQGYSALSKEEKEILFKASNK